jgi:RNA polymerase sigma factor (sigma-70 family)
MDSTSVSLLRRLREPDHDAAWQRFVDLYAPLIFHWAKNQGLNPTDAADLVQEVLVTLVAKLPEFESDPTKRFRGWLRTVALGKIRDSQRRDAVRSVSGQDPTLEATVTRGGDESDVRGSPSHPDRSGKAQAGRRPRCHGRAYSQQPGRHARQ